ncbi:unnamed protein product [Macrosiphum euphorbiae]|uniref:Uncharacterized protein n=1 Tax=Macrosiphum euphorbiae TaxID=13131 RepID=A0AAV0XNL8_9HEMI|nr:unnamed protein product [Macrosiphum euphorbiae]
MSKYMILRNPKYNTTKFHSNGRLEGASVNKRTKRSLTSNELAFLQTVDDKVEAAHLQRTLPTVPRSKPKFEISEENVVCAENATTTCRRSILERPLLCKS